MAADGAFEGGLIAPGINLSLQALHEAAAKLPRIAIQKPEHVIGRGTVEAMQSGVFWGYISLIEGLVARIRTEWGRPMTVIGTGGVASLFEGATDSIPPGSSKVWTVVEGLTGNWVGTNAIFRLWLTGSVPGCRAHAEVAYDFNGNGTADRTEVYTDSSSSLPVLPEYEAYTNAVGTDDSTSGDYEAMKNGKVSVTVFNDKDSAGAIQVMVATNEAPSFITVPYHQGAEIRPPPPPKPEPSHDCPTWYESFQRPAGSTHWVNVKAAPYNAVGDGAVQPRVTYRWWRRQRSPHPVYSSCTQSLVARSGAIGSQNSRAAP